MNDSDLDDRIRAALHERHARTHESLEQRTSVAPRSERSPRMRAYKVLVPALAAVAVLAVLLGTGILGKAQNESAPASPTPTLQIPEVEGPSQARNDYLRDDVYAVVADLPLKQRVGKIIAPAVSTPEGLWVLSSPVFQEAPAVDEEGCLPQDRAIPIYDLCDLSEYSELLLLSQDGSRILRAFPQAGGVSVSETVSINRREPLSTASTWFTVTPDAVYCGNNTSDDPNHDTVLCRIDRENYDVDGLVLNCEEFKAKGGCQRIVARSEAEYLLLPGEWQSGPIVKNAAGVKQDANGELQIIDADGTPRAVLSTGSKFQVTSVLD
ncbi:hypothetical protein LWF15_19845 [Kineosporia rhizophila]|uniref:hypothetical protein n=1 Tax=Kineosporia rhizophila TaxID=84633 RepID=UPI001E442AF5|nr:hypothetical protein [Kineosporia rhizophila]MCE0537749.1 hypothetical protein [Kineosporia rhizophila]